MLAVIKDMRSMAFPFEGAGVQWTPLPQAEAPTEPTGETGGPLAVDEVETIIIITPHQSHF